MFLCHRTQAGQKACLPQAGPSNYLAKQKTNPLPPVTATSVKKRTISRQTFNSLTDMSSDEKAAAAAVASLEKPSKISNEVIEKELERMMTATTSSSRDVTPRKSEQSTNSLRLKPPTPPSTQRYEAI